MAPYYQLFSYFVSLIFIFELFVFVYSLLGFNQKDSKNNSDIANILGFKCVYQEDIAKKIEEIYRNKEISSLFEKYPDFEALPKAVQTTAIEHRKYYLKDY